MMIGRTPEFLGKKIESREMKLVMIAVLAHPFSILGFTALAAIFPGTIQSLSNLGPHGFSEVLYTFVSGTANNGSAFGGLNADTPFFNTTIAFAMLIGAVIAVTLLVAMVRGPVGVKLALHHLSYGVRLPDGLVIVVLYVVAVCGPLLMSGYRAVVLFGVVNLIAVVVIARLTISGFASVWCGWAAVSSAAITLHCRFVRAP